MTESEKEICRQYLNDLDEHHTCNEYKLLMELIEQTPCGDCINRDDALNALTEEWTESLDDIISKFIRKIKNLPPVIPINQKVTCPESPKTNSMPNSNIHLMDETTKQSLMEEAEKSVKFSHDGKKWQTVKIGIETEKLIPDIGIKRKGLQDFIDDDPSLLNKIGIEDIPEGKEPLKQSE